jgi:hypothetical protein
MYADMLLAKFKSKNNKKAYDVKNVKSYRSSFLNSDGCQSATRKLVAFSNAASKTGLAAARMIAWASIFYEK